MAGYRRRAGTAGQEGYGVAVAAVVVATGVSLLLERWIGNNNLVLVYVLAVILTGLRYGSTPALISSFLCFLSFNFFLTLPLHTLSVERQEDLTTLIFLLLIALTCGPVASRIRHQFTLLREANRYSEAMRSLSQALSVVGNAEALWRETAHQLTAALQSECVVAVAGGEAPVLSPTGHTRLDETDQAALDWALQYAAPAGRFTDTLGAACWSVFPALNEGRCIACILVRTVARPVGLVPQDQELLQNMLRQATDTWHRIQLVEDLENERIRTEVEKLRSALLSSISHDLKSPLAAMMGAAESLRLLDKQLQPQDRVDLVDTILQESRRLDTYIQNLLDMTRLGYGTLKIERDWVSIADVVGSALARLKRYHPQLLVETHFEGPAPVLYVHAALVDQALFNILENAAKFTPALSAILVEVVAHGETCMVVIEDHGPGIPEPLRERIFDMFFVVAGGDEKRQGTGMGLAICRGMIAAHRGTVHAGTGRDGQGTRIVVELPIERPRNDAPVAQGDT